jgi:hypothetical protein
VANSALVPIAFDIRLDTVVRVAERTIAVNAVVAGLVAEVSGESSKVVERLIDGDESVARVDKAGVCNASLAEVPIWAVEALVANTIDVL